MDTAALYEIMKAQRNLYLRPDNTVLVVLTKSFENAPVSEVLGDQEKLTIIIDDPTRPGQQYPLGKDVLGCGATVGWIISPVSLSHSVGAKMIEHGMFIISNPGMTEDWLDILNPANADACRKNADDLEKAIGGDKGGTVYVTSADGTDLTLQVPNGNWMKEVGAKVPGEVGTNGLFGEFATAPYNANGTYVLRPDDFLTNPINKLNQEVGLVIVNNKVVQVTGDEQAEQLKKMLRDANNQLAFNLGEFAIGINPARTQQCQTSVVAEKLLGGMHIAIGTNAVCLKADCPDISKFANGRYNAGVHIDCIKFGLTVTFAPEGADEKIVLLQDGKLMV